MIISISKVNKIFVETDVIIISYHVRTYVCKQRNRPQAIDLWRDIPYTLKDLSTFSFAKEIKHYLLSEQYSKKFE